MEAPLQESLAWKRRSRGDRWIKDGLPKSVGTPSGRQLQSLRHNIRLNTSDTSNANFQGDLLDRILLLRLPDPEYEDGQ